MYYNTIQRLGSNPTEESLPNHPHMERMHHSNIVESFNEKPG